MAEVNRKLWTRVEMIDHIKCCGESIEQNADIILGNNKYFQDLTVSFTISRLRDKEPVININRNYIPEGIIEAVKEEIK